MIGPARQDIKYKMQYPKMKPIDHTTLRGEKGSSTLIPITQGVIFGKAFVCITRKDEAISLGSNGSLNHSSALS